MTGRALVVRPGRHRRGHGAAPWSRHGWEVVVADDDRPADAAERGRRARRRPASRRPTPPRWRALVAGVDLVVPSPGVPDHHPVFAAPRRRGRAGAHRVRPGRTRGSRPPRPRPMVAITGTDGKTTVTDAGRRAMLEAVGTAGGRGRQHRGAARRRHRRPDVDVFVVEASSFRLAFTERFRPRVGDVAELRPRPPRLAPLPRRLRGGQGAHLGAPGPRRRGHRQRRRPGRAGLAAPGARPPGHVRLAARADYRVDGGRLVGPPGRALADVAELPPARCRTTSPTPWPPRRPRWTAAARRPTGVADGAVDASRGSPTASRSSARLAGCAGTTTRRRRRPTPP